MAVPQVLINLSVNTAENRSLLEFCTAAMRIVLITLPIVGIQIISANYFQAIGKPLKAMVITLSRQVVFLLVFMYILPEIFSRLFGESRAVYGMMWAFVAADVLASAVTFMMMHGEMKKLAEPAPN
jgi:Na+-driven multidrug efflux pump